MIPNYAKVNPPECIEPPGSLLITIGGAGLFLMIEYAVKGIFSCCPKKLFLTCRIGWMSADFGRGRRLDDLFDSGG
jgi:hypothetical protein